MGTQKGLIFGSYACESWDHLNSLRNWADFVIAADGGMKHAIDHGFVPQVYIGDSDSGGYALPNMISVTLPPEKDLTDLQAAYEWAKEHGAEEIIFTACTGGRQDHHLSALQLLERAYDQGIKACILDGCNRISFMRTGDGTFPKQGYRYFSLIPVDSIVEDVSVFGAKYPLSHQDLHRGDSLTVSNEWGSDEIKVSIGSGSCYVILNN